MRTLMRHSGILRAALVLFPVLIGIVLSGCATGKTTLPAQMALTERRFPDGILAIMPIGTWDQNYRQGIESRFHASWYPRVMYGKGELTTLADPYEAVGLALFNRMRGNNVFKRACIVKDRAEANSIGATHLIAYYINDCYAAGRGANWNFIEWLSYEGVLDVHFVVYDLAMNQRIQNQHVESRAIATSPWSSADVRNYLRLKLIEGVTCHNAVAQISF